MRMRKGEMEHAWVGSTLGHQPGLHLFKLLHRVLPLSAWTMDAQVLTCACTLLSMHALRYMFPSPTGRKRILPEKKVSGTDCATSWNSTQHGNSGTACTVAPVHVFLSKCVWKYIWVYLTGSPLGPAEPSLPCSPRGPGSPWQGKEQM